MSELPVTASPVQRMIARLILVLALAGPLHAEDLAPELVPLAAKFKADLEALAGQKTAETERVSQTYLAALDAAEGKATAAGNVKAGEAIVQERDAVKNGDLREAIPAELPKALHSPRKSCLDGLTRVAKDFTAREDRVKSDYLRTLTALEPRARGNAVLTAQIAAEKEQVLRDITPTSPAGILTAHLWTLGIETWEFAPNGKLIQRQPSPPGWSGKTWRYSSSKKAVECVFGDGKTGAYPFENGRLFHWDKKLGEFKKEPLK